MRAEAYLVQTRSDRGAQRWSPWYSWGMEIKLDVPDDIARELASDGADLSRAALEALALEGYRARVLFESDLCRMLGFESGLDVHAFLKEHGVYLQYGLAELEKDEEAARSQLPEILNNVAQHQPR